MSGEEVPRVAIACQGGGSHTAFTAGVLDRLLAEEDFEFEPVGLSGTSGGAICAFVTWFGLASDGPEQGRTTAREALAAVWGDLAAAGPVDTLLNTVGVGVVRAQSWGVPLPTVSPYDTPASDYGRRVLRERLESVVDPEALAALTGADRDLPRLDIGAVDVQRGSFRTFTERTVSHDAVLASAAVPNLFQAAPVTRPDGTTRYYWDGLFSQNPPLGRLFRPTEGRLAGADELWIVQINPHREDEIPRDLEAIADRRNELGGNLSVNQELGFIRLLNEWAATGQLTGDYTPIEVKTIDLEESLASPGRPLDYASKLDRSPRFLDRLWTHGRQQAERFLAAERGRRQVRESLTATWTGDPDPGTDGRPVSPEYEIHLPTRLSLLDDYLHDRRSEPGEPLGWDGARELARSIREALPDLRYSIDEMVVEPGAVATRWRARGTHTGRLLDIEPTGETVTLCGLRIDHLENGRFVDSWLLLEQWSLLRQLDDAETSTPVSTMSRVAPTPVVTQLSAPAENEELAVGLARDVWSGGDRAALDRLLDDGAVLYLDDRRDLVGRDDYWAFVTGYRTAFPDLELHVEDTVSEGDKIAVRLRLRGTHEGSIFGVEPTGRRVEVSRIVIHHVDDGRIVETGMVEDTLGLIQQLRGSRPVVSR
jgi:NTE family protein